MSDVEPTFTWRNDVLGNSNMAEATAQLTKKATRWLSTLSASGKPEEYVAEARRIVHERLERISQSGLTRPDELNLKTSHDIVDALNGALDSDCTYKYAVRGSKSNNFLKSFQRILHDWVVLKLIKREIKNRDTRRKTETLRLKIGNEKLKGEKIKHEKEKHVPQDTGPRGSDALETFMNHVRDFGMDANSHIAAIGTPQHR